MRLSFSVVFLAALLAFPALLHAEVWRCTQENGTDLFTNSPADTSKCEKFVPTTDLITVPSSPASPPSANITQESPTIPVPYAHDGPTPPEYDVPYYPDYYYSYPYYPYYPYYVPGFFVFRRPHFRLAPGLPHPRGRSFGHGGSFGHGHSFGGHSSGHR